MDFDRVLRFVGALTIVTAIVMGLSYCGEIPKYRFSASVIDEARKIPGTRLVDQVRSGDLTSPVSWFWPATTRLIYARPDITAPAPRFYIMSFIFEEKPDVFLVEPECQAGKQIAYFQPSPGDNGEPALTLLGEPVTAPNGKPFLRYDTKVPPSPKQMNALCNTDWAAERKAVASRTK